MQKRILKPNLTGTHRRGAANIRLVFLLLLLVAVGAGCVYEFVVSRPAFQAAWDKIQEVGDGKLKNDEGLRRDPSDFTSDEIQKLIGQEPYSINDKFHEDCVVHSYKWKSGLLVKDHVIHVVFTKANLATSNSESDQKGTGKLHYYSATAGQPLDPNTNFPRDKQTVLVNLNPGQILGIGGGPPPGGSQDDDQDNNAQDEQDADEKKDDEDESTELKKDSDSPETESGSDDKDAEAKGSDAKESEAKGSENKEPDEKKSDSKGAGDKNDS